MPELSQADSIYDDHATIADRVKEGDHRALIGGLWDEVGDLQFDFLKERGLQPEDCLLDIGCGSMRGGVRFAAYLQPGNYWGVDSSEALLEAGYNIELSQAGLASRVPRDHLLCDDEFRFDKLGAAFDIAIAQSLFTHLSANRIRLCLHRLAAVMRPGGRLFATLFLVDEHHPFDSEFQHPRGITTSGFKDPFHYRLSEFEHILIGLPWRLTWVGDWKHPRDQKMAILERAPIPSSVESSPEIDIRSLDVSAARALAAGDAHYRAFVGPPDRFDFMSASQFALLFALGLRDHHAVLDFGCGSLRLGRLLIPFLQASRYYGIDPNRWLIDDALARETGWSIVSLKEPHFSQNNDFRCDVFDRKFDFIVLQSIITHCGVSLTQHLIEQIGLALEPQGIAVFSIIEAYSDAPDSGEEGWIYPHCVAYREDTIIRWCARSGMTAKRLPWYHPGAVWYAAALDADRLPTSSDMTVLSGAVLFDPQFAAGRPQRG